MFFLSSPSNLRQSGLRYPSGSFLFFNCRLGRASALNENIFCSAIQVGTQQKNSRHIKKKVVTIFWRRCSKSGIFWPNQFSAIYICLEKNQLMSLFLKPYDQEMHDNFKIKPWQFKVHMHFKLHTIRGVWRDMRQANQSKGRCWVYYQMLLSFWLVPWKMKSFGTYRTKKEKKKERKQKKKQRKAVLTPNYKWLT